MKMDRKKKTDFQEIARYSTIGLEIVIAVAIGTIAGVYLDHLFGTSPWLTVACLFVGFFAGLKGLFRLAKESMKN